MCTIDILVMNSTNLNNNIFMSRLRDGDLYLTEFDNRKLDLTNTVNNYLQKKY